MMPYPLAGGGDMPLRTGKFSAAESEIDVTE
jgi:hypothetical protein